MARMIKPLLNGTLRALTTLGVLAGVIWLGEAFGPQRAQAEVFRILHADRLTVSWLYDVGLVFDRAGRAPRRLAGLPAGYRQARWRGSSAALLERLRATAARSGPMSEVGPVRPRWFQAAGPGWIAFGQAPSGGGGFVLFALDAPHGRSCAVSLWDLEPVPGSRGLWSESKPEPSTPGLIERYPGSVSEFELTRTEAAGAIRVVAGFRGGGTITGHRRHYEAVFRKAGLTLDSREAGDTRGPVLLRYSGTGAEATVSIIQADNASGGIVDIVHLRLEHNRRT